MATHPTAARGLQPDAKATSEGAPVGRDHDITFLSAATYQRQLAEPSQDGRSPHTYAIISGLLKHPCQNNFYDTFTQLDDYCVPATGWSYLSSLPQVFLCFCADLMTAAKSSAP
jgi:hypothetical protein